MPDPHAEYSHKLYSYLPNRAILPLVQNPEIESPMIPDSLPDLNNVQGDVIFIFPKNAQNFIFFKINDVSNFKEKLRDFRPTSSQEVKRFLNILNEAKHVAARSGSSMPSVTQAQLQIAFSRAGLNTLGVTEGTGDARFDQNSSPPPAARRGWDEPFKTGGIHGVIIVACENAEKCTQWSATITQSFGSSIAVAGGGPIEGRTRPGRNKHDEHFGIKDGISQPALRGVVAAHPGQIQVDPGVIIMGYKGDPALQDPKKKRPDWTKDGTLKIFSKLEQHVLLFDQFTDQNLGPMRNFLRGRPDALTDLTDDQVKGLFGARLVGRWKSGAPLATCPYRDDTKMANNPKTNNDFDYVVRGNPNISPLWPSDYICPFMAHVRKTAPRNLDPLISKKYLESGSIVRAGIPYGPEVTDEERRNFERDNSTRGPARGLLFVCYASSLDEGFVRQMGFARNPYFPTVNPPFLPQKQGHDPLLGSSERKHHVELIDSSSQFQTGDVVNFVAIRRPTEPPSFENIEVSGLAEVKGINLIPPPGKNPPSFVTPRGAESFFVPSISTLRKWANFSTATLASASG
ncbi:hypothetical protein APHAL10511_005849 [Amanita phalloides]|nr:hypothetical protein APHAL10511_005849 [Amanita phalloides]